VTTPGTGTHLISLLHEPERGDSRAPPGLGNRVWALGRGLAPPGYLPASLPGLSPIRRTFARNPFASIRVYSRFGIFRTEGWAANAHSGFFGLFLYFSAKPSLSVNPSDQVTDSCICSGPGPNAKTQRRKDAMKVLLFVGRKKQKQHKKRRKHRWSALPANTSDRVIVGQSNCRLITGTFFHQFAALQGNA
jgi:hypothetical protein